MNNIAFTTTLSDNYVPLFRALLNSILKNNNFNSDYIIFCDERLNKFNRINLCQMYSRLRFREIDKLKYFNSNKGHIKYYSIECFALRGYDRVIYQGADMLCIKNHNELLEIDCNIGMTKEKRRPTSYSNGNMIIGKKYLNDKTYNDLLAADYQHVEMYGTDQKLFNCFFKNDIQPYEQKFNVIVTETDFLPFEDIVYLHYIHKPTLEKGRNNLKPGLVELWNEYKC